MKRSSSPFNLALLLLLVAFFGATISIHAAEPVAPPPPTPVPSAELRSHTPQPQLGASSQPSSSDAVIQYQPCAGSGTTFTTTVGSDFTWTFYVAAPSNPITGFWVGGYYDSAFLAITAIESGNVSNIVNFTPTYDNGANASFEAYGDVTPPTSATSANNTLVILHFRAIAPTSATILDVPDYTTNFTTGTSTCQATNTIVIQAVDTTPPTVSWVAPVTSEGQRYDASAGTVTTEVSATDSSGIDQVRFSRWDAVYQQMVNIGTVFSPPYQASINVADLNMEWNEIDANVFDTAGNYTHTYFWIYRTQPSGRCTTSSGTWQNSVIAPQTGVFTAEFDATPSNTAMDGVIGFSASAANAYAGMAAIVRFSPQGFIDARNGSAYQATAQIPYTAGTQYHFRMVIRVPNHTYDVYVTPAGASERVVGSNFAFRTEQNSVSSLSNFAMYAKTGSHTACNVTITPSNTPAPPVADFTGAPTSGNAPLAVGFTDRSTGSPTTWAWDFDNNGTIDSTQQNPHFTYNTAGNYTVTLTVTNAGGANSKTLYNYITVAAPPTPSFTISGQITSSNTPLANVRISATGNGFAYNTTTDGNGKFSFTITEMGIYTLIPSLDGITFSPTSASVYINANRSDVNFSYCGISSTTGIDTCKLERGDILLSQDNQQVGRMVAGTYWFHAAMYLGNGTIAEASGPGSPIGNLADKDQVRTLSIYESGWWKNTSDWAVLRPTTTTGNKDKAAIYAQTKADQTNPDILYNIIFTDKNREDKFYCTQLVWKAYQRLKIDLEVNPNFLLSRAFDPFIITGDDLYYSIRANKSTLVEEKQDVSGRFWRWMFRIFSPADMLLIDPAGRRVGIDPQTHQMVNEIPGAHYNTFGDDPKTLTIATPEVQGTWRLVVTGTDSGYYTLEAAVFDLEAPVAQTITRITSFGQTDTFQITDPSTNGGQLIKQDLRIPRVFVPLSQK